MSQSFIEVSKFGFHFLAVTRIALDNRRVVHSKAHFVAFKTVMSIVFRSEYSLTYLLFILSSVRSISIEKGASEITSVYGPQLPSTTSVHNFRPQLSSTTFVHNIRPQLSSTTSVNNFRPHRTLTTSHSLHFAQMNELKSNNAQKRNSQ